MCVFHRCAVCRLLFARVSGTVDIACRLFFPVLCHPYLIDQFRSDFTFYDLGFRVCDDGGNFGDVNCGDWFAVKSAVLNVGGFGRKTDLCRYCS